jgi:hypothetical protein
VKLPSYDELPVKEGAPIGSSWGVWGDDDVFGCLNLLTQDRVLAGLACAREGKVFNLNLEAELPSPPLFNRSAFEHNVLNLSYGHDDELSGWNTQSSSQWDGFRHMNHRKYGFYNGVADEKHGVHYWAQKGIVGRAVLADVARWRESVGRPVQADAPDWITADDLTQTLESEGVEVETGDILLIRTGWLAWYRSLSPSDRAKVGATNNLAVCGLARTIDTARTLWNLHVACVAADNPTLESIPADVGVTPEDKERIRNDPDAIREFSVHIGLLPLLGMPIGELFDLDGLAADCAADGRYACLMTSAPLNLAHGVATPPNALAIK